ncbi:hypothetical protein IV53_GL000523 [Ligilactobacillus ceti DSM 22408]|uniref:Lipopolysaccharide assembly protein A domain-containing protein n=2 Tax=Ligilactobacillus TaxID=2767887 RepID=A0A0R2KGS6_9LACO|nr:hypothetical protein IV53_GL000523 [Ligilactobacillus ceti DSM 22408]
MMKNQIRLIVGAILILIIVIFSWMNAQPVTVNFAFQEITLPLVIVLVGCVVFGILIAMVFSMATIYKLKSKLKEITKRMNALDAMQRGGQETKTTEHKHVEIVKEPQKSVPTTKE